MPGLDPTAVDCEVEGAAVCDMGGFLFDWRPAATHSQACDQINGCGAKSQDPMATLLFSVGLEPFQNQGHADHRSRIGIEQGPADELDVIGVDRHMVGDTLEASSLDRNAAVALAVG